MIDCALFEPDIPQNTGTMLRLGACFGVPIHIIHPAGFALTDRNLQRAGLDYLPRSVMREHDHWPAFRQWQSSAGRRLIALSTRGAEDLFRFAFHPDDVILLGRESAGLPDAVLADAVAVLRIPLRPGNRSLNMAVAGAISVAEALRQTGQFPD